MSDFHGPHYAHTLKTVEKAAAAAGTAVGNGAGVDMQSWENVEFTLLLGTFTDNGDGALLFYAQESNASNFSPGTAVTGGSVAAIAKADAGKHATIHVQRPTGRYVRAVVDPAGGTVIYSVLAERTGRHGTSGDGGTAAYTWASTAIEDAYVAVN